MPRDAEDAVHDAAVLAWTRFDELRDHAKFDAWFDRIVVNACRQRQRRGRVSGHRGGQPARDRGSATAPPVAPSGTSCACPRPADPRAPGRVVLRYLEGHSIAEIAARTGEREGTIKSRLHYAVRELRAAYDAAERGTEAPR